MNGMSGTLALRAVLKKEGSPNIRFELYRDSRFDFTTIENGKAGALWRGFSPQELISGNCPSAMTIQDAWQSCMVKRFPDYVATDMEELSEDEVTSPGLV
jgi:hypothetical protein